MTEIIEKKLLTLAELKEKLEKIDYDEPLYEYTSAKEYAKKFAKLKAKDALALKKELIALDLDEETAVLLVNILPKRKERIQAILPKEKNADSDLIAKIDEILKKYRK